LHAGEIEQFILQYFIRRLGIVGHLPFLIVPNDWRPTEALQNSHLNFLRTKCDQAVKSSSEAFHRFAGKPGDQIGVDMDAGLASKKMKIVLELA